VAAPFPVDAAQLVLPNLERPQRVARLPKPRADGEHGRGRVLAVALSRQPADAVVGEVKELERAAALHHGLNERDRAVGAHLVAAQVELQQPHRARAERARQHRRALLGKAIVAEREAADGVRLALVRGRAQELDDELHVEVGQPLAVHLDARGDGELLHRQRVRRELDCLEAT